MAEAHFEINGRRYRARSLNAFQQLHIARRIAPLLVDAQSAFRNATLDAPSDVPDMDGLDLFAEKLKPLFEALAKMPDNEVEYIFALCLGVVSRLEAGDRYMPIWNAAARGPQFEDITLPEMFQIAYKVIEANLGDFFVRPAMQGSVEPKSGAKGPLIG